MVWNESQQVALAVVPKFSAFASILGSSWIILEVLTGREKTRAVYHRLLCAMSIYDVLESVWNFCSTWPIPRGTPNIWGTAGTTQSCTAQGFFLQLGLAVPMYNACLSCYYLFVIRYNTSDAKLRRKVEPIMHVVSFLFPGATAFAAIGLDLYNSANLWCWIAPLPPDCKSSIRYGSEADCVRGDNAWVYRWAFYFVPLWLCLFVSTIVMILVWQTVHTREAATAKFRHPTIARISTIQQQSKQQQPKMRVQTSFERNSSFHDSDYLNESGNSANDNGEQSHSVAIATALHQTNEPISSIGSQLSKLRKAHQDWKELRARYRQENPKSIEVFHQALFYLLAFYMTHLFSTVSRILEQTRGETVFGVVVLHSFFDPLQGFANFLVYRRPRYLRHRKQRMTRAQAIKRTLKWSWLIDAADEQQARQPSSRRMEHPSSHQEESSKHMSSCHSSNDPEERVSGLLLMTQKSSVIEEDDEDDDRLEPLDEGVSHWAH